MSGPGDHLLTHRAPAGLLEASRPPQRHFRAGGLAMAAAAGILVGIGGSALVQDLQRGQAHDTDARPITLVYHADVADTVMVAGTFNAWNPAGAPMHQIGEGVFRTVLWLPPGQYEYQFVVDGKQWMPDPLASRQRDDGFGSANSVLEL